MERMRRELNTMNIDGDLRTKKKTEKQRLHPHEKKYI